MAAPRVIIETAATLTDELAGELSALIPLLSTSTTPDPAVLKSVVDSSATTLLVGRVDGQTVGMCTLVTYTIPTGVRCWIEDVVVDDQARGHGVGAALVDAAIAQARAVGAKTVDLTSRPSRIAANRLYKRLGFEQRATNVYRYSLES